MGCSKTTHKVCCVMSRSSTVTLNVISKTLVEKLVGLDLAVSYEKVMEIETGIANAVLEKIDSLGGVFLPPWLVKDTFVWFVLDNIDVLELWYRHPKQHSDSSVSVSST